MYPTLPSISNMPFGKVKVDNATDSATASFNYFHLSNALMQNGFLDESLKYINKSLQLNPNNFFAGFVSDYVLYAKDRDAEQARVRLLARWKKDTTRFDILHEVGKMSFMLGDYETAASCYDRSIATMKMFGLDIFRHEYMRVGMAYEKVGEQKKADEYIRMFKDYADQNSTMYKDLYCSATILTKAKLKRQLNYLSALPKNRTILFTGFY